MEEMEEDDEDTEAVDEEVTDHSERSRNRDQNHRNRLSILCILVGDMELATVSNHRVQFQTVAIALSIAIPVFMTADREMKEWSGEDIPLYTFHALRRKIMLSKGLRML